MTGSRLVNITPGLEVAKQGKAYLVLSVELSETGVIFGRFDCNGWVKFFLMPT